MRAIAKAPPALKTGARGEHGAHANLLILRMLRRDFLRKKIITIVVFAFILLSALLAASGSNLIVELSNSLDFLFTRSSVPHFVQMHAGELDQAEIERWAASDSRVQAQQTMEMITIDGSNLYLREDGSPEENSIMDISFVRQNASFDFLLNLDNEIIELSPGQIAVPIYYMRAADVQAGDTVSVRSGSWEMNLTVAAFVRDAQMNPSVVHSKRFLVHESDFSALREHFHEVEYLIEFRLTDPDQSGAFGAAYMESGLPRMGPAVDHTLFRTFNALTDGIVAGVLIVLSLLLVIIAILCLRFTILATIEEDYREIGVLKAIGIARGDILRIYLVKYVAMGALASVLGYLASLYFSQVLSANIMLYAGAAPRNLFQHAIPLLAVAAVFLLVIFSCALVLRRFNRITAVEALRSGSVGDSLDVKRLHLNRSRVPDINLFLGFRDLFQRFKMFGLLCFVFFFSASIIILPVHFLNTMQSPTLISYMGIGRSDIRVDLRHSENMDERFDRVLARLAADADVERFSPLVTSQFRLLQSDGSVESITVESGDFSLFPLDYVEGSAPEGENQIALSVLNARDMEKGVGERLVLLVDGQERAMTISGIYQDVTNGGRTAKATLPFEPESVLWYTVSLDLRAGAPIEAKVREYTEAFSPARVTDLEGYVSQTMGNTISQLKRVTLVAVVVGLVVSILITSLFLNMLISKDSSQIAIMRGLGFSLRDIRIQYLTRALALLAIGIVLGTVFSNTLGQRLVSALWALMGASRIRFVVDPVQAYVLLPLLLMLAVSITTLVSIRGIRESNIARMIVE
jgi:putative ABC transport system permease protein